jgi:hypothetical protein
MKSVFLLKKNRQHRERRAEPARIHKKNDDLVLKSTRRGYSSNKKNRVFETLDEPTQRSYVSVECKVVAESG